MRLNVPGHGDSGDESGLVVYLELLQSKTSQVTSNLNPYLSVCLVEMSS